MAERPFRKIIIVGAGPSGLLLALLLSKHGIPVQVLEAAGELDSQPRAAYYGPQAIPDLARAGIMDEVRRRGITPETMSWRRWEDHTRVTGLNTDVLADVDGMDIRTSCLVLQDLDALMLDEVVNNYGGSVEWNHRVTGIGQDERCAWAECETPAGSVRIEGDYIVGCDGANSGVRKALFGDEFPGFTWDRQIVATNVYYDFANKMPDPTDANFFIHPDHFFMAARMTDDGLYRVTYGEEMGLTTEQLRARQEWKYELMLPGHPKPDEYRMVNFAPYKMHQRCAPAFRVKRVLLAADAAHLCNPWGGMGITGGFVDIGGLYDCLAGIWDGRADESILDLYSEKRIEKWKTVIDPISSANFRRVSNRDPEDGFRNDPFFDLCRKAESDRAFAKQMFIDWMGLRYDFTQHYKDAAEGLK